MFYSRLWRTQVVKTIADNSAAQNIMWSLWDNVKKSPRTLMDWSWQWNIDFAQISIPAFIIYILLMHSSLHFHILIILFTYNNNNFYKRHLISENTLIYIVRTGNTLKLCYNYDHVLPNPVLMGHRLSIVSKTCFVHFEHILSTKVLSSNRIAYICVETVKQVI